MKTTEYTLPLTDEDKVRVEFVQDHGKIIKFVVQYYALINNHWRSIMRIDNCHGRPHRHVYHLRKKEFRIPLIGSNNVVFTESREYILENFQKIKDNFVHSK